MTASFCTVLILDLAWDSKNLRYVAISLVVPVMEPRVVYLNLSVWMESLIELMVAFFDVLKFRINMDSFVILSERYEGLGREDHGDTSESIFSDSDRS